GRARRHRLRRAGPRPPGRAPGRPPAPPRAARPGARRPGRRPRPPGRRPGRDRAPPRRPVRRTADPVRARRPGGRRPRGGPDAPADRGGPGAPALRHALGAAADGRVRRPLRPRRPRLPRALRHVRRTARPHGRGRHLGGRGVGDGAHRAHPSRRAVPGEVGDVTVALLTGLVVGAGLWLVASGLRPAPEPLGEALARIARPPATPRTGTELDERDARVGAFLLERIPPLARRIESVRADLRVVGRPPEEQAIRAAACVLLPLLLGPWVAIVAGVSGLPLPPTVAGPAGLVASALGVVVPFAALRSEARERRAAFAHALSAWCDVVVMTLAAGRGVEQAMETAAGSGEGWAFAEI